MDIIQLYNSILQCGNMRPDNEGFIIDVLDRHHPSSVDVDGKRLVLPTDDQLKHGDWKTTTRFHPLQESVHRGESDVGEKLRAAINMKLNMSLSYLALGMLTLQASPAEHAGLKPDQTIFMSAVKEADQATIDRLMKIVEIVAKGQAQKSLVHIFVRKGATVKGRKHIRAGIVSFPLYEALKVIPEPKTPNEVFGVNLRQKDREALTNLLEYMIPGIQSPDSFIAGSDSTVAPFLDSLLKSMRNVAVHVNELVDLFTDRLPEIEDCKFDLDWEPSFEDLTKLAGQIRMIPMQAGNEGRVVTKPTTNAIIPVNESVKAIESAPMHSHAMVPVSRTVEHVVAQIIDESELDHFGRPKALHKQPLIPPPPAVAITPPDVYRAQQQSMYPQQVSHQGYPLQQPQQQPGYHNPDVVVRTARGTDFRSLLAANPALAAAAGMAPRPGFAAQGSIHDQPRWATPSYGSGYNSGYGGQGGGSGFANI